MGNVFETRYPLRLTEFASGSPQLQRDYFECWQGVKNNFTGEI